MGKYKLCNQRYQFKHRHSNDLVFISVIKHYLSTFPPVSKIYFEVLLKKMYWYFSLC